MRLEYYLIFIFIISKVRSQTLQSVSDDELLQFIKEEEKLIVLFCKYHVRVWIYCCLSLTYFTCRINLDMNL